MRDGVARGTRAREFRIPKTEGAGGEIARKIRARRRRASPPYPFGATRRNNNLKPQASTLKSQASTLKPQAFPWPRRPHPSTLTPQPFPWPRRPTLSARSVGTVKPCAENRAGDPRAALPLNPQASTLKPQVTPLNPYSWPLAHCRTRAWSSSVQPVKAFAKILR